MDWISIITKPIFDYQKFLIKRDKLLTSLIVEIKENLKTANCNIEVLDLNLRKNFDFKLMEFKTKAYSDFTDNLDSKLIRTIGEKSRDQLYSIYYILEEFNKWLSMEGYHFDGDLEPTLESVRDDLKDFILKQSDKRYYKKTFNKDISN